MHDTPRAALALAVCAIVAGCARTRPLPPPPAAPLVTPATLDGAYRGTSTRFLADAHTCPSPGLVTLRVADGMFSYRWDQNATVVARIAPDGSVNGALGDVSLTGRADGSRIEGDVTNGTCAYHFSTNKRQP